MVNIETKLSGDMLAGLERLAEAAGESTLRAAGFAGADLIRNEAKMRAPVKSGVLKASIIVKRAEEKSKGAERQTYLVLVRKGKKKYAKTRFNVRKDRVGKEYQTDGDAYYYKFIEFGTSKMAARPFMRPAFEAMKGQALDAMRDKMREKIAEHLKGGT
jgi:HK97 gp10 family phage protein